MSTSISCRGRPDLPQDLRGPRIFQLLGSPGGEYVGEEQMDEIALALIGELAARQTISL